MKCPYCFGASSVYNTRGAHKDFATWRRRRCDECGMQWTTREYADPSTTYRVKTNKGTLVSFERDQLFASILACVSHRKRPVRDASSLSATIYEQLQSLGQAVWTTQLIAHKTYEALSYFDPLAAGLYAAQHPSARS